MSEITFLVRGIPQTKGSTKAFMPKGARFPIITNDNPKNKGWAEDVKCEARKVAPPALWLGPIRLALVFHVPKPKSLPKRKVSWPTKKPDLSKMLRSVEDAMSGIIFKDDAQIVEEHLSKQYSDAPGVSVCLSELT